VVSAKALRSKHHLNRVNLIVTKKTFNTIKCNLSTVKVCYVSKSKEFPSIGANYSLKMPLKVEKEIVTLLLQTPPPIRHVTILECKKIVI